MKQPPPSSIRLPVQPLVDALLAAHKAGRLDELLAQRPRLTRALARRWLRPVFGAAGDALPAAHRDAAATALLLRWALAQLRPDQAAGLDGIDAQAWLDRNSWRPLLALLCHFGFASAPLFPGRYRPRTDEAAADTLCGLWSVGASTFYRYLDKGRRRLADVLSTPPSGARAASLRQAVQQDIDRRTGLAGDAPRSSAWHRQQALNAAAANDVVSALWHDLQAGDAAAFVERLQRAPVVLANDAETDVLCTRLAADDSLALRQRFDLWLAQAALCRVRQAGERESQALEQALAVANAEGDPLLMGIAYAALGKFHEARDTDRAFACYEDSAALLRRASDNPDGTAAEEAAAEYTGTLVRLAWLYVLRNDPRSRTVLDRAQQLRDQRDVQPQVLAMLEQTWGEYWRRAGDLRRALEHKHRALNLYQRIGDERSVLVTYVNLSPIYGQLKDFDRAVDYAQRVLHAGETARLEPEMLCSVQINLGATYFWQQRYDQAIAQYRAALERGRAAGLVLHTWRAHYNLAEAYYKLYQATHDPADERQGDAHAAAALASDGDADRSAAARGLKTEVLGNQAGANPDRLLPQEFAAHFDEMAEVQRQRVVLAIPIEPAAHVRARLAIARAYLAIAAKERETALGLIHKHGLGADFTADLDALRATYQRETTREERIASCWRQAAADLLGDERRAALLAQLFRAGSINKSACAQACGVAPATASKHLAALTERGLLAQLGKGPATRYALPETSG